MRLAVDGVLLRGTWDVAFSTNHPGEAMDT
jgi:hypothetical protein